MTEDRWKHWGLEPFPPLAPPWSHVIGRGRMVVARYEWESTSHERLSEHWHVDTSNATGEETLQRGDLVVWLGRDDEDDTDLVWPPSLVVRAGPRRQGRQLVSSLTFTGHEAERLDELPGDLPHDLAAALRAGGLLVGPAGRRLLLDIWGVDVLCPECGGLGTLITWGMPTLAEMRGERSGPTSPDDPGHSIVLGGCVVSSERYVCSRCSHHWPGWDEPWV